MLVMDGARPPQVLRQGYLASLAHPQELYLENLVQAGRTVLVYDDRDGDGGNGAVARDRAVDRDRIVGYAVIGGEAVVEFFLAPDVLAALPAAFAAVLDHTQVGRALCKTFDTLLLTAAASRPAHTSTAGYLFREVRDPSFTPDPDVVTRIGLLADLDAVWSIQDGFFDDRGEVRQYLDAQSLFLYEAGGGELLGCGILTRVVPGDTAVDVGMVVAPAHRRRGLGSYIVADLKARCLRVGDRPIAGCDAANLASRRALENAGFTTAHSLLEFTY